MIQVANRVNMHTTRKRFRIEGRTSSDQLLVPHHTDELVLLESTTAITVGLVQNALELILREVLSQLLGHTHHVVNGDLALGLDVVHFEGLLHLLDRIFARLQHTTCETLSLQGSQDG